MNTRRPSPLDGRRPTRAELAAFATPDPESIDDVLPDPARGEDLRLLIVGINPGLWTAAVNAPFARPGNRFWPSLHRAGLTTRLVDASRPSLFCAQPVGNSAQHQQFVHKTGCRRALTPVTPACASLVRKARRQ